VTSSVEQAAEGDPNGDNTAIHPVFSTLAKSYSDPPAVCGRFPSSALRSQ